MRFGAAGLLVAACLLAACSAAQMGSGTRSQAAGRPSPARAGVPLPHSSRLAALTPVPGSRPGATQTYRAASPGHAVLVSAGTGCFIFRHREARETTRSCPVVTVTVVP